MKKLLFLIGLLLAGFLIYFCLGNHAPEIEADIKARSIAAFGAEGLPNGLGLAVDGRDVVLTGTVEDEAIRTRAGDLARSIYGVRVVDNQIQVVEPPPPPPPPMPEIVEPVVVAPPPAPVVDVCQEKLTELLEKEKVNFASSRAVIESASFALLDRLAEAAMQCEDSVIHIHGHTDSSGNSDSNRVLSLARAKAVGRYLIEKGVTQEVRAFGHGSNEPVADNATVDGRAQNRRIEFKVNKTN